MEVLDRIFKRLGAILTHIAVKELALPLPEEPLPNTSLFGFIWKPGKKPRF